MSTGPHFFYQCIRQDIIFHLEIFKRMHNPSFASPIPFTVPLQSYYPILHLWYNQSIVILFLLVSSVPIWQKNFTIPSLFSTIPQFLKSTPVQGKVNFCIVQLIKIPHFKEIPPPPHLFTRGKSPLPFS